MLSSRPRCSLVDVALATSTTASRVVSTSVLGTLFEWQWHVVWLRFLTCGCHADSQRR